ncbi:uncharacterized protein [Montipora foliosa]|uniref:uncharacterized protein n=1 Tax=Montipora foliosa TaxID=591990 RepID=UPI0035F2182E
MPNSQIPAGNFLLYMAVLLAGGSVTKVFQVFKHMGLCCVSLKTFFKYQQSKLFPTTLIYWGRYQAKLLAKVKAVCEGVSIAGDGRHDSMGHSAKFGAYTMFCCTLPMIIHFVLIQRNQAGSSNAMEFMGFKEFINFLLVYGIIITSFISDRHVSIASHMKKVLTGITHYFDIWHLKKKIRKVLSKITKEKGCEALSEWINPCENHLYWSAASTYCGSGQVIYAKFLSHIVNKHSSLPDVLFNKCAHGVIKPRKWLNGGSVVYDKLYSALTSLAKGIKQALPFAQTSCLQGFHSLLNQFAPKRIAYSYVGMYCRHILAIVHFNSNLQRELKKKKDGVERVKVSKFNYREGTVRNARIVQNFDQGSPAAKSYFVVLPVERQLSKFLSREGFYEDLLYRFTSPMAADCISDVYDGFQYQKLFHNGGVLSDQNNLSLKVNTDGVPIFKSSGYSMCPIYFEINELLPRIRLLRYHSKWNKVSGGPTWKTSIWSKRCLPVCHSLKYLDVVDGIAVDYMHGILLGVTKQLLNLWLDPRFSGEDWYCGTRVSLTDKRLMSIKPPNVITRVPRSLEHHRKYWKASELHAWLFHYSSPCRRGILPERYLHHYLLLVNAVWLVNQESITKEDLACSNFCFVKFVHTSMASMVSVICLLMCTICYMCKDQCCSLVFCGQIHCLNLRMLMET